MIESQGEARLAVSQVAVDEHVLDMAETLLDPQESLFSRIRSLGRSVLRKEDCNIEAAREDQLKIVEYALLISPITNGVDRFVDDPGIHLPGRSSILPSWFVLTVGDRIASNVISELRADPRRLQILERLAEARAESLSPGHADKISPLIETINNAARSSSDNMYTSTVANALTVHKAKKGAIGRNELFAVTRNSHQLALARPMSHFYGLHPTSEVIDEYNMALMNREEPKRTILKYVDKTETVNLVSNPRTWINDSGVKIAGTRTQWEDEAIGCPISFSPDTIRRYYGAVVDLVDEHHILPRVIESPLDSELSFLVPGIRI